jgi:hypothetical protein
VLALPALMMRASSTGQEAGAPASTGPTVTVLPETGIPVTLQRVSARKDIISHLTELMYSIENQTNLPLKEYQLTVTIGDRNGNPIGGLMHLFRWEISARATERGAPLDLPWSVGPGQTIVVSLEQAATKSSVWTVPVRSIAKRSLAALKGAPVLPLEATGKNLGQSDAGGGTDIRCDPQEFCNTCQLSAVEQCQYGIQSFDCVACYECKYTSNPPPQ